MPEKKAQYSPGLRNYLFKHNLREASEALRIIQDAGYKLDDLDRILESKTEALEETRSSIVRLEDHNRILSVAMEFAKNHLDTQDIYKEYRCSKDKEKFLRSHETEIQIHEVAKQQLKETMQN